MLGAAKKEAKNATQVPAKPEYPNNGEVQAAPTGAGSVFKSSVAETKAEELAMKFQPELRGVMGGCSK